MRIPLYEKYSYYEVFGRDAYPAFQLSKYNLVSTLLDIATTSN